MKILRCLRGCFSQGDKVPSRKDMEATMEDLRNQVAQILEAYDSLEAENTFLREQLEGCTCRTERRPPLSAQSSESLVECAQKIVVTASVYTLATRPEVTNEEGGKSDVESDAGQLHGEQNTDHRQSPPASVDGTTKQSGDNQSMLELLLKSKLEPMDEHQMLKRREVEPRESLARAQLQGTGSNTREHPQAMQDFGCELDSEEDDYPDWERYLFKPIPAHLETPSVNSQSRDTDSDDDHSVEHVDGSIGHSPMAATAAEKNSGAVTSTKEEGHLQTPAGWDGTFQQSERKPWKFGKDQTLLELLMNCQLEPLDRHQVLKRDPEPHEWEVPAHDTETFESSQRELPQAEDVSVDQEHPDSNDATAYDGTSYPQVFCAFPNLDPAQVIAFINSEQQKDYWNHYADLHRPLVSEDSIVTMLHPSLHEQYHQHLQGHIEEGYKRAHTAHQRAFRAYIGPAVHDLNIQFSGTCTCQYPV